MAVSGAEDESRVRGQNGLKKREVVLLLRQLRKKEGALLLKLNGPIEKIGQHADPGDCSKALEHHHVQNSLRENDLKTLKKVRAALRAIFQGEYGVCNTTTEQGKPLDSPDCTGVIDYQRLKRTPEATQCAACILAERGLTGQHDSKKQRESRGEAET